jgi:hypothetical protein
MEGPAVHGIEHSPELFQLAGELRRRLHDGADPAQRALGGILTELTSSAARGEQPSMTSSLSALGALAISFAPAASTTYEQRSLRPPIALYIWGREFLKQMLKEIRAAICSDEPSYSGLRKEYHGLPKAAAVAVSTFIMGTFGVDEPVALGTGVLALLTVAHSTRNAFCNMTDDEVLRAIDEEVEAERRRQVEAFNRAFKNESGV